MRFSHDGRPFLAYESRAWLIEPDGKPIRPSHREVGWWRPVVVDGKVTDELEVLFVSPTGLMELYLGRSDGPTRRVIVPTTLLERGRGELAP